MAMSRLPIIAPVTSAYKDAWFAMRAMPMIAGWTLIIMIAGEFARYIVKAVVVGNGFTLASAAVIAVQCFFVTPIMIMVHRFIILEGVAPRYEVQPGRHFSPAYFGWLTGVLVISCGAAIPFKWLLRLSVIGRMPFFPVIEVLSFASLCLGFVATIIALVVVMRLAILLPAIAVEMHDATADNAWGDSKHHGFRIFYIVLLTVLPLVIGALLLMSSFSVSANAQTEQLGSMPMFIMAAVQTVGMFLWVAVSSRLCQALADRVLRSMEQQPG
jgi:hypothetical protein